MSLEKRPPGVMLYFAEMRPLLAFMTDEERGQILAAIFDYAEYDAEPILSDRLAAAWPFIKNLIDRDVETYRKKCEKAEKTAKARWEKSGKGQPVGFEEDGDCWGFWSAAEEVAAASAVQAAKLTTGQARALFHMRSFYFLGVIRGAEEYRSNRLGAGHSKIFRLTRRRARPRKGGGVSGGAPRRTLAASRTHRRRGASPGYPWPCWRPRPHAEGSGSTPGRAPGPAPGSSRARSVRRRVQIGHITQLKHLLFKGTRRIILSSLYAACVSTQPMRQHIGTAVPAGAAVYYSASSSTYSMISPG